jgi:phosphoribosylformylglycinamidine cyclo-ligase
MRYADAGVNITVADQAKRRISAMAGKTFRRGVLAPIGAFGSLFQLDRKRWRDPVLVASCDGVGTKLKVACAAGIHSTVGADILNHCVNDILTQGAEPLFFLDYIAMGKLDTRILEQVIEGMSRAAKLAGCSLIGGETAEMPDVYAPGDYDLAGFIVGAVERKKILDPRRVRPGDLRCPQAACIPTAIRLRAS